MIHELPVTNLLIDARPARQRNRILKLCTVVDMDFGTVLCEADQSYQDVYLPLTGFISVTAVVAENPPLELGLIGNEGMLGIGVALDVNRALKQSVVQGSGTALKLPVAQFQQALLTSSVLAILLNRYIYIALQNLAQAAVCIHCHELEARAWRC